MESLSDYSKSTFQSDLLAGLTVSIMLIPQGMAYAFLAGMPPIYGLYGGLVPLLLYAILGTSRQLSIGPVAVSALLVLAGVSQLAEPGSAEYISLVITAGLLIGILQFSLCLLRMGFLVNFISHPVIAGFSGAAAIIIAISQLKDVLGFPIPRFSHVYETVFYAIEHIQETNWIPVAFCISAIILMLIFRTISRKIPDALLVVVIGTLLAYFFNLEQYGLDIIKDVPEGLPALQVPNLEIENIKKLIPTVMTVTIIGIVESVGIAKVLESKHQYYVVRPNQELLALGISKIGGAFFQSLPTSGSFTRSAINNDSGARTGVSSIVTVVLVILTLLFFTPLFYYLPKAVLAAIILLAVRSLFDYKEAIHLWHTHKRDFMMMMVTFFATLVFGIEEGVLAGVLLSISDVLYRSSQPNVTILGNIPNTTYYRNIERFDIDEHEEDMLIIRFENQLYFGNAAFFKDTIKTLLKEREDKVKYLLLDAKSIHDIDSSGLHALSDIHTYLKAKGVQLYITGAIGKVRDRLIKGGLEEKIGTENMFLYLNDAVEKKRSISNPKS